MKVAEPSGFRPVGNSDDADARQRLDKLSSIHEVVLAALFMLAGIRLTGYVTNLTFNHRPVGKSIEV